MRRTLVILLLGSLLASCGDSGSKLERFSERNKVGDSSDYWLEIDNAFGDWERVALIFAYYDDEEGCSDIASALSKEYGRSYRCSKAN